MPRLVTVAVLALVLCGCRAGGATTPSEDARAAAQAFVDDCARRRVAWALDILAEPVRERFVQYAGLQGCMLVLGLERADDGQADDDRARILAAVEAGAVTVRAEQYATVAVSEQGGRRSEVELERRGELWRITSLRNLRPESAAAPGR